MSLGKGSKIKLIILAEFSAKGADQEKVVNPSNLVASRILGWQ